MLKLDFPIISFSDFHLRGNINNSRFLERSISSYLDRGGYVGDTILDATGKVFKVKALCRKGLAFAPWYNLTNKDKLIKIELELEKLGELNLAGSKDLILDHLLANKSWWKAHETEEDIRAFFESVNSIRDITSLSFARGLGR